MKVNEMAKFVVSLTLVALTLVLPLVLIIIQLTLIGRL